MGRKGLATQKGKWHNVNHILAFLKDILTLEAYH